MRIRDLFVRGSQIRYRIEKLGSGINFPDPQHWAFAKSFDPEKVICII